MVSSQLLFKFVYTDSPEPSKRVRSAAYLEDASSSEPSSPSALPNTQLIFENHAHNNNNTTKLMPTINTPLLMAPPSTTLEKIQHRMSLYRHYIMSWVTLNRQTLQLIAKLGIFLVKMLSITRPCSPVATRESIWYPLIALAALELALGTKISWRVVGILTAGTSTLFPILNVSRVVAFSTF